MASHTGHSSPLPGTSPPDRRLGAQPARRHGRRADGEGRSRRMRSGSISRINSFWVVGKDKKGREAYADTVIPERDIVLLPLEADVDFLRGGHEFVEVTHDGVTFGFGYADDCGDEARVEEDGFPAGDGVLDCRVSIYSACVSIIQSGSNVGRIFRQRGLLESRVLKEA